MYFVGVTLELRKRFEAENSQSSSQIVFSLTSILNLQGSEKSKDFQQINTKKEVGIITFSHYEIM